MTTRPTLNVNNNHIRNFSMQHYMHRYFNEVPTINRHLAEINRKNNVVTSLLDNKESFMKPPEDTRPTFILKRAVDGKLANKEPTNVEPFTVKKRVTFGDIIDNILTFILVVIFIIFLGNLAYICFFQDSDGDWRYI